MPKYALSQNISPIVEDIKKKTASVDIIENIINAYEEWFEKNSLNNVIKYTFNPPYPNFTGKEKFFHTPFSQWDFDKKDDDNLIYNVNGERVVLSNRIARSFEFRGESFQEFINDNQNTTLYKSMFSSRRFLKYIINDNISKCQGVKKLEWYQTFDVIRQLADVTLSALETQLNLDKRPKAKIKDKYRKKIREEISHYLDEYVLFLSTMEKRKIKFDPNSCSTKLDLHRAVNAIGSVHRLTQDEWVQIKKDEELVAAVNAVNSVNRLTRKTFNILIKDKELVAAVNAIDFADELTKDDWLNIKMDKELVAAVNAVNSVNRLTRKTFNILIKDKELVAAVNAINSFHKLTTLDFVELQQSKDLVRAVNKIYLHSGGKFNSVDWKHIKKHGTSTINIDSFDYKTWCQKRDKKLYQKLLDSFDDELKRLQIFEMKLKEFKMRLTQVNTKKNLLRLENIDYPDFRRILDSSIETSDTIKDRYEKLQQLISTYEDIKKAFDVLVNNFMVTPENVSEIIFNSMTFIHSYRDLQDHGLDDAKYIQLMLDYPENQNNLREHFIDHEKFYQRIKQYKSITSTQIEKIVSEFEEYQDLFQHLSDKNLSDSDIEEILGATTTDQQSVTGGNNQNTLKQCISIIKKYNLLSPDTIKLILSNQEYILSLSVLFSSRGDNLSGLLTSPNFEKWLNIQAVNLISPEEMYMLWYKNHRPNPDFSLIRLFDVYQKIKLDVQKEPHKGNDRSITINNKRYPVSKKTYEIWNKIANKEGQFVIRDQSVAVEAGVKKILKTVEPIEYSRAITGAIYNQSYLLKHYEFDEDTIKKEAENADNGNIALAYFLKNVRSQSVEQYISEDSKKKYIKYIVHNPTTFANILNVLDKHKILDFENLELFMDLISNVDYDTDFNERKFNSFEYTEAMFNFFYEANKSTFIHDPSSVKKLLKTCIECKELIVQLYSRNNDLMVPPYYKNPRNYIVQTFNDPERYLNILKNINENNGREVVPDRRKAIDNAFSNIHSYEKENMTKLVASSRPDIKEEEKKLFIFDLDETLFTAAPNEVGDKVKTTPIKSKLYAKHTNYKPKKFCTHGYRKKMINHSSLQSRYKKMPFYAINQKEMKLFFEKVLQSGHKLAFVTSGQLEKTCIKDFFLSAYNINIKDDSFEYYKDCTSKNYALSKIVNNSNTEKNYFIDNNKNHIHEAKNVNNLTCIYADNNKNEAGKKYIDTLNKEITPECKNKLLKSKEITPECKNKLLKSQALEKIYNGIVQGLENGSLKVNEIRFQKCCIQYRGQPYNVPVGIREIWSKITDKNGDFQIPEDIDDVIKSSKKIAYKKQGFRKGGFLSWSFKMTRDQSTKDKYHYINNVLSM